jgi:AraC-like DNA-binding protein
VFQKLVFERKTIVTTGDDGEIHRYLEGIILEMRREFFEKEAGFRLAVKARLYDLALLLLRHVPARQVAEGEIDKRKLRNELLERIFNFVHDNYTKHVTLDDAAAAANLSKFYFSRFFKEQTGQTFHVYLSRVRISRAEELLAGSDLPVTEIAYRCGFSSLKTFNRLFRTFTGTSPSRYRLGAA